MGWEDLVDPPTRTRNRCRDHSSTLPSTVPATATPATAAREPDLQARRSASRSRHLVAGRRAVPAARGRPLRHVRRLPDRPEHPLQPVRLERARTAHRLRRHRQLPPGLLRSAVPRRRPPQRHHHRPVAAPADPVRLGPGAAAQRQAARSGPAAHAVLRPLHPVRGRHRRRVAPDPATGRPARPEPHGDRCRGADPRMARRPRHRPLQPVLRDLVEVLRLPHDPHPRRPPADPQGAHRGRPHRRRVVVAALPLRDAPAARTDDPGVGVPLDHRRPAAVRPRVGHHQGRADRRLVDDGDVPLRAVPQEPVRLRQCRVDRDLRALARRRPRLPTPRDAARPPREWFRCASRRLLTKVASLPRGARPCSP